MSDKTATLVSLPMSVWANECPACGMEFVVFAIYGEDNDSFMAQIAPFCYMCGAAL